MRRFAFLIFTMIVSAIPLAISGCARTENQDNQKPRFAFIVNIPTDRFWDIAYAGCLQAAQEEDVIVEFHAPGESTAAQQKQILETLMSRGIDGVAISPLNPDSLGRFLLRIGEQFPVICQDSDAPESGRVCYIGTDNVAHGRMMGNLMKEALPEGGQVALFVGQLDVANARERQQGVLEVLAGSNITVVDTYTDRGEPANAKSVVTDVLSKHPDLKGCLGLWGYNAPQAVNALRDFPARIVKVVGSDESLETMRAIRDGKQYASVAQTPYHFGYQSIKILARVHRGENVDIPQDKMIFTESFEIRSDNLEEVEADIAAKLKLKEKLEDRYGK